MRRRGHAPHCGDVASSCVGSTMNGRALPRLTCAPLTMLRVALACRGTFLVSVTCHSSPLDSFALRCSPTLPRM